MPDHNTIGNTRRLRPVHQYLKITNGIIDLDSRGLVQSVTEDFDDNDVVDPRYITSTNVVKFPNNADRNAEATVVWIKGDLAIVDGLAPDRTNTGTYVYVGNDQEVDKAAATENDDWELLSVTGQFETSNQLNTWNPDVTYFDRDQVSFAGKLYTANLVSVGSITGVPDPAVAIVNDQDIWIEGFADRIQGVRADGSVQFLDLETVHRTLDSGLLGVRFERVTVNGGDGPAVGTTVTRGTVDTSVLQRLIPSPVITETTPGSGVFALEDPSQIFLKFNPNAGASNRAEGDWRASRIRYSELVEAPTVLESTFVTALKRNAEATIVWRKGDLVNVAEDSTDTGGILLSKGIYVYAGDSLFTARTTTSAEWQFLGINTLADTALQSIVTSDGTSIVKSGTEATIEVAKSSGGCY